MNPGQNDDHTIPIAHEELRVGKREAEVGRVRVRTLVDERTVRVAEELAREDVEVEWVDVNREIDRAPDIRTEGDTLVIPLFEEVLVIEKRLVLRQELRLTRRMVTRPFQRDVPVRTMRAEVEQMPPPGTEIPHEEPPMRTLTAFFDTRDHAEQARQQLLSAGLAANDVTLSSADSAADTDSGDSGSGGFMQKVKDFFMPHEDRQAYEEEMKRGGVLLTAHVPGGLEDRAIDILDRSGAVDFDTRQAQMRSSAPMAGGGGQDMARGRDQDVTIPVAEERLKVGKREVDRGSVRVRSYVTEEPVQEQVNLREEHVNVERRPVNERVEGPAEGIFEERSFEATERAEEPVVAKETIVTEEVRLSKDTTEHSEKIEDKVRKTDVEVDDGRGRPADDQPPPRPIP